MGFSLVISDFKFNSARSDKIGYTGVNSPKFVEIISMWCTILPWRNVVYDSALEEPPLNNKKNYLERVLSDLTINRAKSIQ